MFPAYGGEARTRLAADRTGRIPSRLERGADSPAPVVHSPSRFREQHPEQRRRGAYDGQGGQRCR